MIILDESVVYNFTFEEYEKLCTEFVKTLMNEFLNTKYISDVSKHKLYQDCINVGAVKLRDHIYDDCNIQLTIKETIDYIQNMI
jgi:hypothetical protein